MNILVVCTDLQLSELEALVKENALVIQEDQGMPNHISAAQSII